MKPLLHTMRNPVLSLLLLLVASSTAHAKLVAWYPFDEPPAAPDIVNEIAGDSNDAFTIGFDPDAPEFSFLTRGHPSARPNLGTAYLLAKGGGVELGNAPTVQPTDKFTIAFWVQPFTLDAFDRFLESQAGNGNDQDGIRIDMGSGNVVRVLVRDANGATNTQFNHPTTLSNDGTWYFVAFRYDSEGDAPFQLTVVEHTGDAVDEAAITSATGGPATLNTGPLHTPHGNDTLIGVENNGGTGGNSLNAALDELAFYDNSDGNGVLTDAQLADVYNFGPSGVQLIETFTTDKASVSPGNPAALSWTVAEPFDTLVLDDGLGNVTDVAAMTTAGAGTFAVSPSETTTYKLVAIRGEAANTYTLRVLAGAAPDIDSFTASAELIKGGDSVDLSWLVTGAESISLDGGVAADVTGTTTISAAPSETTTYTLSATNGFGTSTAVVTVTVVSGPIPAHRYNAADAGNDDINWADGVSNKNMNVNGVFLETPLAIPSANTNLTVAYTSEGGLVGASVGAYQFPDFTAEIWLRPGELTSDHGVIFETGGGQNGLAALMTDREIRFIGSAGDERTLDLKVSLTGLVLDDFLQLVFSTSGGEDTFEVSIRDTFGNVKTASEVANVILGGNGATLFAYGAGGLGGDNNLGGRTEAADVNPEGLSSFVGEIALINIYDIVLSTSEIEEAFQAIATNVGVPPVIAPFVISQADYDAAASSLTLTWDSADGESYGAQFSTDLEEWFDLDGPFPGTGSKTTQTLTLPPNQAQFYVRIGRQIQ